MIEASKLMKVDVDFKTLRNTIYKYKEEILPLLTKQVDVDSWVNKLYNNAAIDYYTSTDFLGLAAYYCNDHISKQAFLSLIFISPEYAHKGIGSMIIEGVLNTCKAKGMKLLILECNKENLRAIKFYSGLGGKMGSDNNGSLFFTFSIL